MAVGLSLRNIIKEPNGLSSSPDSLFGRGRGVSARGVSATSLKNKKWRRDVRWAFWEKAQRVLKDGQQSMPRPMAKHQAVNSAGQQDKRFDLSLPSEFVIVCLGLWRRSPLASASQCGLPVC